MWWRLAIGVLLGYLGYRVYRKVKANLALDRGQSAPPLGEPETLVQDPVCLTFIPRRNALKVVQGGKDYFFCSEGCLKRFRQQGGGG